MSSSNSIFDFDEILGFSSTSNGAIGRVIEDITRNIHLVVASTTVSLVKNKTYVGVNSIDEVVDL